MSKVGHTIVRRSVKSVLIAVSGLLLFRFVSERTDSLVLALSYSAAYGTWRTYEEFSRRRLSTAPKVVGSAVAFVVAVVHGALTVPRTSAPVRDMLYFGAFLLPELIILLLSRRIRLDDVTIQIPKKKRQFLDLPSISGSFLQFKITLVWPILLRPPACLSAKLQSPLTGKADDLGILSRPSFWCRRTKTFSTRELAPGQYRLVVKNESTSHVQFRVQAYLIED